MPPLPADSRTFPQLMQPLPTYKFVLKRIADDWKLLLSIFSGVLIASALVSGAPIYLNSLKRLAVNTAIERSSSTFLNLLAFAPNIPLRDDSIDRSDLDVDEAINDHLSEFFLSRERYLKGPVFLVGTPRLPLPSALDANERASRGYFQYLSNIEKHVTFIDGVMASDEVVEGRNGPMIEAILGTSSAKVFGLSVGDKLLLTPSIGDPKRITVEIVGLMNPTDPAEEYWKYSANLFVAPAPLDDIPDVGIEVDPQEPPLALLLSKRAMLDSLRSAYPGTLLSSTWFIYVDKAGLKRIEPDDLKRSVQGFEDELSESLPGSAVFTGIETLLRRFERRSFFSSVPLLLLLTIMVITVLYYLTMMVSYLVQSREADVALLRSRGVSTPQLVRLYAIEGLAITTLAVVIAPFLAFGAIALSGKLPFFSDITGGSPLPVDMRWSPFLVAGAVGAISMAIFVVPGVLGARAGLIIHKLRSSRPPSVPLFQRYYLDLLLLVIGGLVFWELNARGQLVSGGLFKGVQVNEALLLAPVLVLTLVALVFMRLFPLLVRYIGGESAGLQQAVIYGTTVLLALTFTSEAVRAGAFDGLWLPLLLTAAIGATFWATDRAESTPAVVLGIALQAILVTATLLLRNPVAGSFSFIPSIALMLIVPMQLLYIGLRAINRAAPIWLSLSLWNMARNPLQYSWLVLLLVMVTGLGVLSTTVGGTLDRSYEDRISYEIATDIRVIGIPTHMARGRRALKEKYLEIPGVTGASLALRGRGSLGTTISGGAFEVLALESQEFHYLSWYRDDFSDRPLSGVMRSLQPQSLVEPLLIPEDAVTLAIWARPQEQWGNIFLWMVVQDARGVLDTVTLGELGAPEWGLMTAAVPRSLKPPLQLVSIQIFEPVYGPSGTPGSLWIDDIHAIRSDGSAVILEDFELGRNAWTPLATSVISSDRLTRVRDNVFRGAQSAVFKFGKDTDRGIRGFYRSPSGGPIPVVASETFMRASGVTVGQPIIVNLMNRLVPIVVQDTVNYFPTLDPSGAGFILTDLDGMLRHLNILSPTTSFSPNELYLTEAPGAEGAVRDAILALVGDDQILDRRAQIESIRLDPLITAGWKALSLLAVGIIILSAGMGYVTYLLAFSNRNRSQMGYLQSLGLSYGQMLGLLVLEHFVIVVIGLGLGTATGFFMSNLMVTALAVTEDGFKVIPPFILETDLGLLIPIYGALIGIFLASLLGVARGMKRIDLRAISRIEGG